MFLQWRHLLFFFLLIVILIGCQAEDQPVESHEQILAEADEETSEEEKEVFQPYEYAKVPDLKRLIFAEGFKKYTSERPYLLGYSYDGDYVASIIYDRHQEGYIVEVTDTLSNDVTYEAFVPDAERILKGEQVSIDLLETAQESLDMGYRLKVAPVVNEQKGGIFEQQGAEKEMYRFQMRVEEERLFRISVHDQQDHTWFVVNDRNPLEQGREFIPMYVWAIHPQVPDRVNVMVYTQQSDQTVKPFIYTVNTAALERQMSEEALGETLSEWLKKPNIVYRFPSTANARSLLAVETEGEEEKDYSSLYAGIVKQFVLLDQNGELVVRASAEGVFDKEDQALSQSEGPLHFEIALIPSVVLNEAELFIVDVYEEDRLLQSLEWKWSDREGEFQYIQPGEAEQ